MEIAQIEFFLVLKEHDICLLCWEFNRLNFENVRSRHGENFLNSGLLQYVIPVDPGNVSSKMIAFIKCRLQSHILAFEMR